jgi:hypothetical protein
MLKPKVTEVPRKGKKAPKIVVKCGCCEEKVEIYLFENFSNGEVTGLEIGGVFADIKEWRKILGPLLAKRRKVGSKK